MDAVSVEPMVDSASNAPAAFAACRVGRRRSANFTHAAPSARALVPIRAARCLSHARQSMRALWTT